MTENLFKFNLPELNRFLKNGFSGAYCMSGLNPPLKLAIINHILSLDKKILLITSDEQSSLKYQKDYESLFDYSPKVFPYQEISPYATVDKNYYIYKEQFEILKSKPDFIVMPIKAALEKFPDEDFINKNSIKLEKNKDYDLTNLINTLVKLGYKRSTMALDIGEFAIRGDILDVYGLYDFPLRVEFFADTIEDIRFFNPNTQKSFKKTSEVEIQPLYKFIANENIKTSFKKELEKNSSPLFENEALKLLFNETKEKIENFDYFEGVEYYISYINKNLANVFDYFKDYILIFDESALINSKAESLDYEYSNDYKNNLENYLILPLSGKNHLNADEFKKTVKGFKKIGFDNFIEDDFFEDEETFSDKITDFNSQMPPSFVSNGEKIAEYIRNKLKEKAEVIILTAYKNRVEEILKEFEVFTDRVKILPPISTSGGEFKIEGINYTVLSDKELFSRHSKDITTRKYMYNKQSPDYIDSVNDIREGEYVVHYIHGIGIFRGLTKQDFDGSKKDYLEIEFQGKDKLFMPAEQINLLKRYRGTGVSPSLSKMGGASWENIKNKAKKEVKEVAYDLLKLYAKRKMSKGIAFQPDTNWQYEMEDSFEFTETKDQMQAIIDTKSDMESDKPMDRLICADVGFGKTEVATRAIFKAVMSGYQAIMIAPTTILSLQHFKTIEERFKPFSVNVQLISRFKTLKERKKIKEMLKNGTCDVVIGTHGLLADIEYKNLGLLVVDEEHKFGVNHKEKLKKYKENIDILSMSATPIPRTLNMALSGLKDLSLINTPPKNRLPVKTYVGEFNEGYLKNAINHELQRDGQVYFVHNRVEDISRIGKYVQDLVPNARVAIAHGQMAEKELEQVMFDFLNKEYDVLVCTTIVESGLDIPNTNTIIIDNSDRFGLAQLYQLRGRVGRSDRQAYCYCFYKQSKELNSEAIKRLKAIKDFTSLGSGYQIAMRDIEIRGVGNILGAKQHGHMVNVGFDTYCALLEEAIEELKEEKIPPSKRKEKFDPCLVDIKTNAYIPDDWAGSYEQKMIEYKKLAEIKTLDELEAAISSFKDRFAKLPLPVENLFKLIRLRILGTNIHITQIQETPENIRIYTPFTVQEWRIINLKLPLNITKYFKWTKPQKTDEKLKGVLLMKNDYLSFDETFNILADLFYYISKVVLEFKQNKEEK